MNNIDEIEQCTGCMGCIDICPTSCITQGQDIYGHIKPLVDTSKCISCGKCLRLCPQSSKAEINFHKDSLVYAAQTKDPLILNTTSSGGIATVLSQYHIANGGVVYGCSFEKPFGFKHVRCDDVKDLDRLKGSKYVQSDMLNVYRSILSDLKNGIKVMFIGLPCQVSTVKRFVGKLSDSLITIDLICHGVPSEKMLSESLPKDLLNSDINSISFRDSTKYQLSVKNDKNNIVYKRSLNQDLFMKGFFTGLFYRDSCFYCRYAHRERCSDITLGDFWGIKSNLPDEKKNKGISLCLVNSSIGEEIFTNVQNMGLIYSEIHNIKDAVAHNEPLNHPTRRSVSVKIFRQLYPIVGFKAAVSLAIPHVIIKNWLLK